MLKFWNRKADRAREQAALALYSALTRRARDPRLYTELGVPDTFDGRFDALALYVSLMLARLSGPGASGDARDTATGAATGTAMGKEISSLFVADMDRTMREAGVGDLSVGKHVKKMASAMLGRFEAYGAALATDGDAPADALAEALARNVWRGAPPMGEGAGVGAGAGDAPAALAVEVREFWAILLDSPLEDLLAGQISGDGVGAGHGI